MLQYNISIWFNSGRRIPRASKALGNRLARVWDASCTTACARFGRHVAAAFFATLGPRARRKQCDIRRLHVVGVNDRHAGGFCRRPHCGVSAIDHAGREPYSVGSFMMIGAGFDVLDGFGRCWLLATIIKPKSDHGRTLMNRAMPVASPLYHFLYGINAGA